MTLQERITLGTHAERLMEDPAFAAACEAAEEKITSEWKTSQSVEFRERAHAQMTALYEIVTQLGVLIGDAEMAKAERDKEEG